MKSHAPILFISDLHLSRHDPHITRTFFYFLENIAIHAKALYILGDFFESYVGDDHLDEHNASVADALHALTTHNVPVFLMHGNRDFLVRDAFAKRAGVLLIPDPSFITVHNQKIILLHGDSLCTDDKSHQLFRAMTRNRLIQRLFLWLPLSCRKKCANKLRYDSTRRNTQKTVQLMDVSENAVNAMLKKYNAEKMIHGHTHRPMISENRIVLDAWHAHGNYLQVDENGEMRLINFEL